jgi:hypothetical protein
MAQAEFTAHIGSGDEAPKFDKEAAEQYLQQKEIHKLMGGLMKSLVDSKPADPVEFLLETLTQMESSEAAARDKAEAEQAAGQQEVAPVAAASVEPEPES